MPQLLYRYSNDNCNDENNAKRNDNHSPGMNPVFKTRCTQKAPTTPISSADEKDEEIAAPEALFSPLGYEKRQQFK